ncbi:MAG: ribbon-helix-helix protein, CopG family [Acidimicrobiia bacterium]
MLMRFDSFRELDADGGGAGDKGPSWPSHRSGWLPQRPTSARRGVAGALPSLVLRRPEDFDPVGSRGPADLDRVGLLDGRKLVTVCGSPDIGDRPPVLPAPRALPSCAAICREMWQHGNMAKIKTTLTIDADLMRQVRIRAARSSRSQSEVLEAALREGLGVIERIRAKARLSEEEALDLASKVVHQVRAQSRRERKR